jgi:PAS domain S-box-containing protein
MGGMADDVAPLMPEISLLAEAIFGDGTAPIATVAERAGLLLPDRDHIVWEGDPATFEFTFVSDGAERILGHAPESWLQAGFWAEVVLHPEDRASAIAYCALATGQCRDHEFEYRAVGSDGQVRWLYDIVKVVVGSKGVPRLLRGLMVDVTTLKETVGEAHLPARRRFPELPAA